MGGGLSLSAVAHQISLRMDGPILAPLYEFAPVKYFGTNSASDAKVITGGLLFGIGWGAIGVCPGAAIVGLAVPFMGGHNGAQAASNFGLLFVAMAAGVLVADVTVMSDRPIQVAPRNDLVAEVVAEVVDQA